MHKSTLNDRVDALIGAKKPKQEDWNTTNRRMAQFTHVLCKTYGWDYHTLMKQPISFVWCLFNGIALETKMQNQDAEKGMKQGKSGFGNKGMRA